MFCPFCGKQIRDDTIFCKYCGKALPQKRLSPHAVRNEPEAKSSLQDSFTPRKRKSYTGIKAVITVILIVALVIFILSFNNPGLFPWN